MMTTMMLRIAQRASPMTRQAALRQLSTSSAAMAGASKATSQNSIDAVVDDGNFRGQDEWRAAREAVLQAIGEDEEFRNSMAYSLAMSSSRDSKFPDMMSSPNLQMKRQMHNSEGQLLWSTFSEALRRSSTSPLPRTLSEATRPHAKEAIVVTEVVRPFRIVNVNKAWEGLCEYTATESRGRSLGELLQGEETDQSAITALMSTLLRGEEAGTILTNYTKTGRKFKNRLRVGPIYDEDGKMTHFVGVLQEEKARNAQSASNLSFA